MKQVIPYFHAFELEPGMKDHSFYLTPQEERPSVIRPTTKDDLKKDEFLTYWYDPKTGKYTRSDGKKTI